jgi:hypothetical protein
MTVNYCGILTLEIIGFLLRYFYNIGTGLTNIGLGRKLLAARTNLSSASMGDLAAFFRSISRFLMEESICFRTFWIVSTDTLDALSWNKKVIG